MSVFSGQDTEIEKLERQGGECCGSHVWCLLYVTDCMALMGGGGAGWIVMAFSKRSGWIMCLGKHSSLSVLCFAGDR